MKFFFVLFLALGSRINSILYNSLSHYSPMAAANSDEILYDFSPLLKIYKDGRIERPGLKFVPPSVDPVTGVRSKDVLISSETGISARIHLPGTATKATKLAVVVFFHGGGFLGEAPYTPLYHKHLNFLAAEANVITVTVDYRWAPEHPLPAAYEDSWLALKWIASSQSNNNEEWIKEYADKNRVYLGGDSAGANIAHNIAMRVGLEKLDGINVRGMFLNCPFFSGNNWIGAETLDENAVWRSMGDVLWPLVSPTITDRDVPWINPAKDPMISRLGCRRVLVYSAEKDALRDRSWLYKEVLERSGWGGDVEVVEVQGEVHCFSVMTPDGKSGLAMLKRVGTFINDD